MGNLRVQCYCCGLASNALRFPAAPCLSCCLLAIWQLLCLCCAAGWHNANYSRRRCRYGLAKCQLLRPHSRRLAKRQLLPGQLISCRASAGLRFSRETRRLILAAVIVPVSSCRQNVRSCFSPNSCKRKGTGSPAAVSFSFIRLFPVMVVYPLCVIAAAILVSCSSCAAVIPCMMLSSRCRSSPFSVMP